MRRHVQLFVIGCLLAGGASAAAGEFRFPKTGTPAFLVNLPEGWTTYEDQLHRMELIPVDHSAAIYLAILTDKTYEGQPLENLAVGMGLPSKIKHFLKDVPADVSGHKGRAFLAQTKNPWGDELDVKFVIIPLAPDQWATMTVVVPVKSTDLGRKLFEQPIAEIALTTDK